MIAEYVVHTVVASVVVTVCFCVATSCVQYCILSVFFFTVPFPPRSRWDVESDNLPCLVLMDEWVM